MRPLVAAECKQQIDLRKSSSAQRQAGGVAMYPMVAAQVAAGDTHLALIGLDGQTQRQIPDGVLQVFAEDHHVRCAETIVLVAAKNVVAIDVSAAKSRLEIKRNAPAARRH